LRFLRSVRLALEPLGDGFFKVPPSIERPQFLLKAIKVALIDLTPHFNLVGYQISPQNGITHIGERFAAQVVAGRLRSLSGTSLASDNDIAWSG